MSSPTAKPSWQDWSPENEPVSDKEYWEFQEGLVRLLILWVSETPQRLPSFIKAYPQLVKANAGLGQETAAAALRIDPTQLGAKERVVLSNTLRDLITRHREYPDAHWTMGEDELKPLEKILHRFEPVDANEKYRWLFEQWPNLPGERSGDYKQREARLKALREQAVSDLWSTGDVSSLLRFSDEVAAPFVVGVIAAGLSLTANDEGHFLQHAFPFRMTRYCPNGSKPVSAMHKRGLLHLV